MKSPPETEGRLSREEGPFPLIDFRHEKWMNQFKVYCVNEEEPNKCWLQLSLDNTTEVLYKVAEYEKTLTKAIKEVEWERKVGDPCLGKYLNEFYRAVIIGDLEDGKMLVRYVDYGNQERVKLKNIIQIPKELIEYPEGATLCILNDFRELEEAVESFEDMADKTWMCEINWPSYKAPDGKIYPLVSLFEEKEGSPFAARFGIPRLPVTEEIKKANPFLRFGPPEYQTQDENAPASAPEPKEQENKVVLEKREVTPVKTEVQVQPPAPEKAKQPLVESSSMNIAPPSVEVDGGVGVAAGDQKRRKLSTLAEEESPEIRGANKVNVDAVDSSSAAEAPVEVLPKVVEIVKEEVLPVEKAVEEPVASKVVGKPKFNTNFAKMAEKRKYSSDEMVKMQAQAEVSKILLRKEVVQTPPPPPPALTKEMMSVTEVEALTQPQTPVFYLVEKSALDNEMKRKEGFKKRLQTALDKFNATVAGLSEDLEDMNKMAKDLKLID